MTIPCAIKSGERAADNIEAARVRFDQLVNEQIDYLMELPEWDYLDPDNIMEMMAETDFLDYVSLLLRNGKDYIIGKEIKEASKKYMRIHLRSLAIEQVEMNFKDEGRNE